MDKKSQEALKIQNKMGRLLNDLHKLGYDFIIRDCFGTYVSTSIKKRKK